MTISVYCDGSSASSGGKPGGWAFVIVRIGARGMIGDQPYEEDEVLVAGYGGLPSCTNNVAELTAAIRGLEALNELIYQGVVKKYEKLGEVCELVSDSQYTLNMANGGWTPSRDEAGNVKNGVLIDKLQFLAKGLLTPDPKDPAKPRTRWVPGHTGDTFNERCDSLAKKGKEEAKRTGRAVNEGRPSEGVATPRKREEQ